MKKRVISTLLATIMSFALLTASMLAAPLDATEPPHDHGPPDGASDWAWSEGLVDALDAGLVPDSVAAAGWGNNTTRLSAADAIVRLIEKVVDKPMSQIALECGWDLNSNHFSDTASQAATFLKYAKVIEGTGGNNFFPDDEFNRAQIVTMIGRAAENLFGIMPRGHNPYIDDIPGWAAPYVAYMADTGITKGVGDNIFDSYSVLQNQDMALISWRAYSFWGNLPLQLRVQSTYVHRQASPVDDSFFADAAFIGNSLIDGLRLFSGLTTCDYYGVTSMTVRSAANSVFDRLRQKQYGKIYILLGINEIGFDSWYFKELYIDLVASIIAMQPGADIYIMGLTPVSRNRSNTSASFNMTRVRLYNERLYEVAEEMGCYYIDLCDALAGPDGYLPAESTWDGVHLNSSYYKVWLEYLKYHYVL